MAKTEIRSTQVKDLTVLVDDLRDFGPEDGGSLNLNIKAGRIRDDNTITDKSAQVVALTDSTTNFVELSSLGVASANTSAFTSGSSPIAEVVTSGGSISSITDKRAWIIGALAGGAAGLPAPDFTSAEQAVTVNSLLDVAHGLGAVPTLWQIVLRCKEAELGYSIGDEIMSIPDTANATETGWTFSVDAINMTVVVSNGIRLIDQSTFNVDGFTRSKFKWVMRAWK